MSQVPEAEGGAAEVFEAAVDRLGRAVGRAGPVEEREDVRGTLLQSGEAVGERRSRRRIEEEGWRARSRWSAEFFDTVRVSSV